MHGVSVGDISEVRHKSGVRATTGNDVPRCAHCAMWEECDAVMQCDAIMYLLLGACPYPQALQHHTHTEGEATSQTTRER